jgi:uncharacterized protein
MKTKYKPQDTATSNPNQGNQNAPGCLSHTGESLIKYGQINEQTRSKKTKYKSQDTATSNPNQGNQNAPGCLSHTGASTSKCGV